MIKNVQAEQNQIHNAYVSVITCVRSVRLLADTQQRRRLCHSSMASSIMRCGIADHASTNRCFSSLMSLTGDSYTFLQQPPDLVINWVQISTVEGHRSGPMNLGDWVFPEQAGPLFHVPLPIRRSVVPVSLSLRRSLFNDRAFKSLLGNSLINRFAR